MPADWFFPTGFKCWGAEEEDAIKRVVASDRFTYGPETEALEDELANYHARRYCIATNSGSSANWIAVAALFYKKDNPLRRGDFAIVPSIAWATTWAPLIVYGINLLTADVDDSWNIIKSGQFDHLKPRLLVRCPILGNPAHLEDWEGYLVENPDIEDIEDACESLGAVAANGQRVGDFGRMSTLSFFMSHQIAGIEGGAVLTDDYELYKLLRQLRNHGWERDTDPALDFAGEYRFVVPGTNTRPLEINAAVQRCQLRKLDGFVEERRRNLEYFLSLTKGLPITPQRMTGSPSPFGLSFTVEGKDIRERLAIALREAGIDCRLPTGGNFARHPLKDHCTQLSRKHFDAPHADYVHDHGLFCGNAPYPIPDKIERAAAVIRETLT